MEQPEIITEVLIPLMIPLQAPGQPPPPPPVQIGGAGVDPRLLLWLLDKRRRLKKRKPSLAYLVKLLRTIDIIRLLEPS